MKQKTPLGVIYLTTLLCLLGTSASHSSDYDDYSMGMHYGPMGMMPMGPDLMLGGPMGFGMLRSLDLSSDQEKKINNLHDKMREEHWKIMGEIRDIQKELRDAMLADNPNPENIGNMYEKITKLQRKILEDKVATLNKVREFLTEEQLSQLKSDKRRYGWGGGPMMRHRWSDNR